MVPTPQTTVESGVFGRALSLPAQTPPEHAALETQLDWMFDFYRGQQDQRGWYGFWNYGDVMHTYDFDRHVWRYDVGGYAWDNSELATDVWLWMYFLRTGRADTFRFAEAMTRHTGEVDVHHLGRFAPLGSRHNVQHWGCSAKQLRISTALNRRFYYFLTADERVGDLMREQLEAGRTLRTIQPGRKLADAATRPADDANGDHAFLGFGTDWGSLASAWLTEWERTRDPKFRDRLLASMKTIGAQPRGFFNGGARLDLVSGAFDISRDNSVSVSHLSAAFGLPEVCAELIELLTVPRVRARVAAVLRALQRAGRGAEGCAGRRTAQPQSPAGPRTAHRFRGVPAQGRETRRARLGGVQRGTRRLRSRAEVRREAYRSTSGTRSRRRKRGDFHQLQCPVGARGHRLPRLHAT
jgi:hypothetical protein